MEVVLEHKHPLRLIDLQPDYPHGEEEYEEEEEDDDLYGKPITRDHRCRPCHRCKQEINWFQRYYYRCSRSTCGYSIHKFCGELPVTLKHTSHDSAHTLTLFDYKYESWSCVLCRNSKKKGVLCYKCSSAGCGFKIHANCAMASVEDRIIYHPSHQHTLASIPSPLLSNCDACGKKHNAGIFYLCTISCGFFIHSDCAFLPKRMMIQKATNHDFSHPHPLILSYSFPYAERSAKLHPTCRVCSKFFGDELWIYKCERCRYYTHIHCTTSREEPFMSIISSYGNRKLMKNYKDSDYPDLVHLPFHDESDSMLKHLFSSKQQNINVVQYHQHPLTLVGTDQCSSNNVSMPTSSSSSSSRSSTYNNHIILSCHDPMNKIQLLCNGCVRPVTSFPFYKCTTTARCNFVLHEWCTRLPPQLPADNYSLHDPQHTLILNPNVSNKFFSVFNCAVCGYPSNGFAYSCTTQSCDYHIDVKCSFIPQKIAHDAHPGHLLSRVQKEIRCRMCLFTDDLKLSFLCDTCPFAVHIECALLLPREITHKYDKHPMSLTYFPVENHKSDYFCEICETKIDPECRFYHCSRCAYSMHPACTPLILQSEAAADSNNLYRRIYTFLNIKFGGILNHARCHPHPLSFVHGIKSDGKCIKCNNTLHYEMIFKCRRLSCKFGIHWKCFVAFEQSMSVSTGRLQLEPGEQ